MKVLLVNGSPRAKGCTYTALCEIEKALNKEGIETEIFHIGPDSIVGDIELGNDQTTIKQRISEFVEKAKESDGFVFGSPVHYAAASGVLTYFLDHAFYNNKAVFEYKPGAAICSCRRGGASATFDQINKYFTISNMPVVSSNYWNMVHGNTPKEVVQDIEGMQIMRVLGTNMAWLLKCIELGKQNGVNIPQKEDKIKTNFIR